MNGIRILLTGCILLSLSCHVALAATNGSYTIISSNLLTDVNGTTIKGYDGGLAFDGTNLWYATRYTTNTLYRIDPETQKVTAQWLLPFAPYGVAWDGTHLRIVDSKNEPRVRAYDLQGNATGSQLVQADSTAFRGLAWDGTNLWGADDWLLLKFDAGGAVTRVYPNTWLDMYTPLAWDGTNLVAYMNGVVRIDPLTGNVSSYRTLAKGGPIAFGSGRMWTVYRGTSSTPEATLYELVNPPPAPLPPFVPTWGVFELFEGFAVPQTSSYFAGAGLGAYGTNFWYCDFFNVSKVSRADHSLNASVLDMDWPVAGGAIDVASDGKRVWLLNYATPRYVISEATMRGEVVTSFFLPAQKYTGVTWDGEALWVLRSFNYTTQGIVHEFSRYSTNGNLLFGPVRVSASLLNTYIADIAWHAGKLWLHNNHEILPTYFGAIACIEPSSGAVLGTYYAGTQDTSATGLASDGMNLYVVGQARFAGATQPTLGPWILRLGMPTNMVPPKLIGAATGSNSITFSYNKGMKYNDFQYFAKSNYVFESPIGTAVNLTPAILDPVYTTNNQIRLSGLTVPLGNTWKLSVRLIRDPTGNVIREDGVGNVLTGIVGGLTAPGEVTATEVGNDRFVVSWRDSSAGETGFRVERRSGSTGSWEQVADIPTGSAPGMGGLMGYTNFTTAGGDYYYRVSAYNSSTLAYSEVQKATRGQPFGLLGGNITTNGSVTIQWNGIEGKTYRVLRSNSPSFEDSEVVIGGIPGVSPVTSFTDPTPKALGWSKAFYRVAEE